MKEKVVNSIIEALKNYRSTHSKGDLIVLIKEYSRIGLYRELSQYIRKMLDEGGDISDLIEISDVLPDEISGFLSEQRGEESIDEDFDADSFLEMGELLWEIGSPEEARENYIKAFEFYNILGEVEAAKEVLNTLKERYPDDTDLAELQIMDMREQLYSKLDEMENETPQDEVDIRATLGKRMHEEDILEEAEYNYRRVLKLDSNHRVRRYLVSLLKDMEKIDEALEFTEGLENNEKIEEKYSIAEYLRDSGALNKSREVLREIYEIDPDYKDVAELIGEEMEMGIVKEVEEEKEVEKVEEAVSSGKIEQDEGEEGEKKIVFL